MKKARKTEQDVERVQARINTITQVLSKVSVSNDTAERWDRRRQRLHEAKKILSKEKR